MQDIKIHCKYKKTEIKSHPTLLISCDQFGNIYGPNKKRKLNLRKDGYLQVSIKRSSYLVHRIIAETWIDNKYNKPKINHINGVKADNNIKNLQWCTQRENILHARDVLKVKYNLKGRNAFNAKIGPKELVYAKNMFDLGLTNKEISIVLNVCQHTVGRVLNGAE